MKRKRILLCILCSVLLLFSMSALTVHAHPGNTDSTGGHNDYINGGYHYHHGFSAHSHYDIDGDGTLDCPIIMDDYSPIPYLIAYLLISAIIAPIIIDPFLSTNIGYYQRALWESLFFGLFCCVCFLFPLGFLFVPAYRKILNHFTRKKTQKNSVSVKNTISQSSTTPPSSEFSICHTIWLCTYHISRHCAFSNNPFAQGHIWATLFYIAAKHIRNQSVVDQIYSHFIPSASDIAEDDPYPERIAVLVQHGYKEFAPILNTSGIDPRTPEGIQQLWELIKKEDFKYKDPHPSAIRAYFDYSQILISNIATYHKADDSSAS